MSQPAHPVVGTSTILLVEDEEVVRHLLQLTLTMNGFTVLQASNAEEAHELAIQHRTAIGLLVTDLTLPGENGFQLAASLEHQIPGLRTLYLSGLEPPDSVPPEYFLGKPFSPHELVQRVTGLLQKSQTS